MSEFDYRLAINYGFIMGSYLPLVERLFLDGLRVHYSYFPYLHPAKITPLYQLCHINREP